VPAPSKRGIPPHVFSPTENYSVLPLVSGALGLGAGAAGSGARAGGLIIVEGGVRTPAIEIPAKKAAGF
jgi:hypothetical protein